MMCHLWHGGLTALHAWRREGVGSQASRSGRAQQVKCCSGVACIRSVAGSGAWGAGIKGLHCCTWVPVEA